MIALLLVLAGLGLLMLAGSAWEAWQAARERRRVATRGQFVQIGEIQLHAVVHGRRRNVQDPAIILDGGLTNGSLAWPAVTRALENDWLLVSFDRAGHNWSSPAPLPRNAEALLAEQRALLAALHITPPWVLVAHSFSGHIARLHAARHPEDVAGLVLVEATPAPQVAPVLRSRYARALAWKVPLARLGLWRLWSLRRRLPPLPGQVAPPTMITTWLHLSRSARALAATQAELACFAADHAAVEAAPPPRQPSIVLASTEGAVAVPPGMAAATAHEAALAAQRDLAARLPRGQLRVVEAPDHDLPWSAPGEVAAAIEELARHAAPARRPG
ncbi:alpha/beta fold hydrolase [Falsiroseomonas selenitidurans]|uniref:Alpha/beta hydrolase n=1 Tax=Falsiroseomonas selenitidurans TaxID=2716335 RepID=A0ABX1EER0_9PROT|nr:alpha/beta fold hydrolase [Falsiroseomonas selenitidurans]NKC34208.1 alpha/beta hydrolase [Falsiroseomonas selenitidurans]